MRDILHLASLEKLTFWQGNDHKGDILLNSSTSFLRKEESEINRLLLINLVNQLFMLDRLAYLLKKSVKFIYFIKFAFPLIVIWTKSWNQSIIKQKYNNTFFQNTNFKEN